MNGGHDLGGMDGLGAINPKPESTEPVFHHEWEKRAFALTLACGFLGQWNLDESRHARERQHPADYLRNTYYENWMQGIETLLSDKQLLDANKAQRLAKQCVNAQMVPAILSKGGPVDIETETRAQFKPGDWVRVNHTHTTGHTRIPRYCAGRVGIIESINGFHVYPDSNAKGERIGHYLYSVNFSAEELWGKTGHSVNLDLWQPYLSIA